MKVRDKDANIVNNDHAVEMEAFKERLKEMRDLTGCPLAYVIQNRCEELDCINQGLHLSDQFALDEKTCKVLKELSESGEVVFSIFLEKQLEGGEMRGQARHIPKPIIETKPRLRCVL